MLALAGSAAAQEFRATVKGQVVDSSQAALPGATITVRNQETGEVATATSNSEGNYTMPFLRPGLVQRDGGDERVPEVHAHRHAARSRARSPTINAQLGVGGLAESVNVSAEAPLLETSNANRGTVIDQARIAELPLQSRSPMALATLVAGVNYNAQAVYLRPFDNGALADWSMNGGQNRNNEFLARRRAEQRQPGRQQHRLRASGGSGAGVQGLDQLLRRPVRPDRRRRHQHVAEVRAPTASTASATTSCGARRLAANSFLLNSRSAPKTDQYIDQYGFSVDGPIFKNKTFFLFTGEKYREGTPDPLFSTVPTPAMKNGDFSGLVDASGRLITIYDPATGRDVNGVWTRDPFPGNIIPADRISPTARGSVAVLPGSRTARPSGVAPWQQNLQYPEHFNKDRLLELGRQGRSQLQLERPRVLPLG